jgi:glycosyltransferase involved in cell wall biosynthesis
MRIMIVTDQYPPQVGGVPTATQELGVHLADRGHQVWVVAPSYGTEDIDPLEQKVSVYRFLSFQWPTGGLRIPFFPVASISHLLKKADPDIIHIHTPVVLGNIAQLLAGALRKPVIVTHHHLPITVSYTLTNEPFTSKRFSNIIYSYLVHFYKRCDYVTAPTVTALNLLYEHGLSIPGQVISNGVDLKKFTPGAGDEHLRQRFNLPKDRPIILLVNRLSHEKRINVLLDAAAKISGNGHIVIGGTGPAETSLRRQVRQLNISDRVTFLGFVQDADLRALHQLADVFVNPSVAELQSIAMMKAMACGLPIIASDSYALPELACHGENGFVFQSGNSDELARYLDILLAEPALRAQMGAKSLQIIAEHDIERILDQWETLYEQLANEFADAKARNKYTTAPQ